MSVESQIKAAVASTGYPCEKGTYSGTATTYFVMMLDTDPANFADDAPRHERFSIMLHLVTPKTTNTVTLRKTIKTALFAAGFSYPSMVDASDEKETRLIFEFQATEAV